MHSSMVDASLLFYRRSGAALIKWGQWAAARPDLFPADFCDAMSTLQVCCGICCIPSPHSAGPTQAHAQAHTVPAPAFSPSGMCALRERSGCTE